MSNKLSSRTKSASKIIRSYTLIELLIAISIIALLSVLAFITYSLFLRNARDTKRVTDLEQIKGALEMYKIDNNVYPTACPTNTCPAGLAFGSGSLTGADGKVYMMTLPQNPKGNSYTYAYDPTTDIYTLSTEREIGGDYSINPFGVLPSSTPVPPGNPLATNTPTPIPPNPPGGATNTPIPPSNPTATPANNPGATNTPVPPTSSPAPTNIPLTPTLGPTTTLVYPITAPDDDHYQLVSGGIRYDHQFYDKIYFGDYNGKKYTTAFRFNNIAIPKGSTIVSAIINGSPPEYYYDRYVSVTIYGQASDNPTDVTTGWLMNRPKTSNSVVWTVPQGVQWYLENSYPTVDFAQVVQEVIDRPGWSTGNSIVIIFDSPSSGYRSIFSFEGNSYINFATKLNISYR